PEKLSGTLTYYYVTTKAFSPLALANRLLFAVLLCALAYRVRDTLDNRERLLLKLYGVGFCIYLLFMSIDVIASRTNVYFRILEVALLPTLLYRNRNIGRRIVPVLASVLLLISLIYVKDIRAVMGFSEYYSHNPLQYPYITVFAPDMLMNERYIAIKFEPYMNEAHYDRFDFDEYYRRVLRKPNLTGPALPY
ncbi:MAG: EpsG family protein, partial [Clostridia bacterium]